MPIYSFHHWLPKAHVEAPTLGSIILAGLLLKLGSYGVVQVLPIMVSYYSNGYFMLSLLGALFGTFICCIQRDVKAYIAYSSVVHMNFNLFLLILVRVNRKRASYLIIVLHGIVASLLF
jgi:NADH-quinone oxidoreductase subunit M